MALHPDDKEFEAFQIKWGFIIKIIIKKLPQCNSLTPPRRGAPHRLETTALWYYSNIMVIFLMVPSYLVATDSIADKDQRKRRRISKVSKLSQEVQAAVHGLPGSADLAQRLSSLITQSSLLKAKYEI